METSLYRQSLALVLTTQNKQEKIHQKHKINKLVLGKKNTKTHRKPLIKPKSLGSV